MIRRGRRAGRASVRLIGIHDAHARQRGGFQRFHALGVAGLDVVVAERVQYAVQGQVGGVVQEVLRCSRASRASTGTQITISPRATPSGSTPYSKVSTLVA